MRKKPTFSPFEVTTSGDGKTIISTWRHPNGETEQWEGDKFVYGPDLPQKAPVKAEPEEPNAELDPEEAAIEHTPKASQPEEPKHEDKKAKGK